MNYCDSPYQFQRRETRPVTIGDPTDGGVVVGGSEPIVRQSMITWTLIASGVFAIYPIIAGVVLSASSKREEIEQWSEHT